MARQVLENGVILPAEYSDDWYDDMSSNLTKLDDVIGSDSEKLSSADVGAAALSNSYNDLDNLPTIPTVNDATLTIQKNGVDVQTFTANASSNVTANITVPTKTSDLTNDSNFVDTSNAAVASGITSAKVTDYDAHIADTDIHVTTADKNKWNNGVSQAYVFRYSSTALTPSSTNSNTLLDNTDNLKVGDKVIDSSGVLFSITAIDTQNSTFTIGTALVDLAQDSDVVHKSGNETIAGIKTFSDYTYIRALNFTNEVASPSSSNSAIMPIVTTITYTDQSPSQTARLNFRITPNGDKSLYPHENNQYALGLTSRKWSEVHAMTYYYGSSDVEFSNKFVTTDTDQTVSGNKTFSSCISSDGSYLGNEPSGNERTNLCLRANRDTAGQSGAYIGRFRQNRAQGEMSDGDVSFITFDFLENSVRYTRCFTMGLTGWDSDGVPQTYYLTSPTSKGSLGTSLQKWQSINGLNPSSLGMPDLANGVDISSYITIGNTDDNYYTPSVNGWIWAKMIGNGLAIQQGDFGSYANYVADSTTGDKYVETCLLVTKNVQATIRCRNITSIVSAKFYPCQGNV